MPTVIEPWKELEGGLIRLIESWHSVGNRSTVRDADAVFARALFLIGRKFELGRMQIVAKFAVGDRVMITRPGPPWVGTIADVALDDKVEPIYNLRVVDTGELLVSYSEAELVPHLRPREEVKDGGNGLHDRSSADTEPE